MNAFVRIALASLCLASAAHFAAAATAVDHPAPILHLPFDGSVEATVGKNSGVVRAQPGAHFVEGRFGQAIALTDGAHLIVPLPGDVTKGEFSISFWLKPLWSVNDNLCHPILEIPDEPGKADAIGWSPRQWLLSKGFSEAIAPNYLWGVTDSDAAKRHLKPDQWTHVLVSFSARGKFQATYFDGEGNRIPLAEPPVGYGGALWIGRRADGPGAGAGNFVIDDLKIYDTALGQDQVPLAAGTSFPPARDYLSLGNSFDVAKIVQTPHVEWGKPLHGGAVRVLCIAEGRRAREFAELAQRVELDPIVFAVPCVSPFILKNRELLDELGRKVEASLKDRPPQCIVIGAFGWNLFPETTRKTVLRAVEEGGAGLLLSDPRCVSDSPRDGLITNIGNGLWQGWSATPEGQAIERLVGRLDRKDEDYLLRGVPWDSNGLFVGALASKPPAALFRGGKLGKGRILLYDIPAGVAYYSATCLTPGFTESARYDEIDYDNALAAAARAVLWAASREPVVRVESVLFHDPTNPSPRLTCGEKGEWLVDLWNTAENDITANITLATRTSSPDAPATMTQKLSLKPAATRIAFPQSLENSGRVYADARVLLDGRTTDWATSTIEVDRGNPWFVELACDRPAYPNGQSPEITARIAGRKYVWERGHAAELRWRLYDNYDRLLARGATTCALQPSDEDIAECKWHLSALADSSLLYRLVVDLLSGDRVTDRRELTLLRRRDSLDDFHFVSWQGGGSAVDRLATRVMRDRWNLDCGGVEPLGRPVDAPFHSDLESLSRQNLRPWVHATHIGGGVDANRIRVPDLSDPHWQQDLRDRLSAVARIASPYSPLFYSLGDETRLGPADARASGFEQEAFRAAMRDRFGTIEKLNAAWGTKFQSWTDIVPPAAGAPEWKTGSALTTALVEFRESLYADALRIGNDAARSVDPDARVGVEGIFGLAQADTGQDYYKMTRGASFLGLYPLGMQLNMARSFQKPGDLLAAWYNYGKLDREYSLFGPWHLLMGGGRAFMWYTTFEGSQYSALNPDFTPTEQFSWTNEELQPILNGIGKLIVGLQRDDLGVAILYNQRNLDRASPNYLASLTTSTLLNDLGIQNDWIHGDQIVAGALTSRKVKVLFLPGQVHMREQVAAEIRRFVENGGAIVADVMPAQSNGFRRFDDPILKDIFADDTAATSREPSTFAVGEKTVGRGRTLIYPASPPHYNRTRAKPGGLLQRQRISEFLTSCGVAPSAKVEPSDGHFQPCAVVTYHDGGALYVAAHRDYTTADFTPREFVFTSPLKAHVYDVRAGTYLGETDKIKRVLEVARGALVAFLPYRATKLEIHGLPDQIGAGELLNLRMNLVTVGGSPEHGVFRIDVTSPDGQRVAPLSRKTRWVAGYADATLAIALNDPAGKWNLRVTDIATGLTTDQTFEVVTAKGR